MMTTDGLGDGKAYDCELLQLVLAAPKSAQVGSAHKVTQYEVPLPRSKRAASDSVTTNPDVRVRSWRSMMIC